MWKFRKGEREREQLRENFWGRSLQNLKTVEAFSAALSVLIIDFEIPFLYFLIFLPWLYNWKLEQWNLTLGVSRLKFTSVFLDH